MNPILRTLLALLLCLIAVAPAPGATDDAPDTVTRVRLHATVRLARDHPALTLGDLARIEGLQADALGSLSIDPGAEIAQGRWSTITLDSIRARLAEAAAINDGSLIVTGTDIQVTRLGVPTKTHAPAQADPTPLQADTGPVLRDHIERWLYARLNTTPDTTRIQYADRDRSLLATPTAGRIVQISELGRSDRMSLHIVIYEGERIIVDDTLRFDVQTQRPVRVARAQIRRRAAISEETTVVETRWLAPTEPIADPTACLGQVCRTTIDPGSILLASMLEPPIVIERGEIISARSLAGSVSVSMSVRARSDGKMGELIELESRDRSQRFTARVAGPGQAVIVNDPAANKTTTTP